MRIYLKHINGAKFHPDPIWNDGTLAQIRNDGYPVSINYVDLGQLVASVSWSSVVSWWRSIVVRPPVLPVCFPYPTLDWQLAV